MLAVPCCSTRSRLVDVPCFGFERLDWFDFRLLNQNALTGPIPSGITALTNLRELYARSSAHRHGLCCLRHIARRRRNLNENRFSGSVPSTISALRALTILYAPLAYWAATNNPWDVFAGSSLVSPAGLRKLRSCCRDLQGNQFEGQLPSSILSIPVKQYAIATRSKRLCR